MTEPHSSFEGWAIVEMLGHQREIGFVTTRYFGDKAMFQVDIPEVAEREQLLHRAQWLSGALLTPGSVVLVEAIPGRTRIVSPASIYALNPCTEEVARLELERHLPRTQKLISLAEVPALGDGSIIDAEDGDEMFEEDGDGNHLN